MVQQMNQKKRLKKVFWLRFEKKARKCSLKDVTVLLGDFNAKLESNNTSHKEIMGKHGLGTMNEIEEMFTNLCANNNLAIRELSSIKSLVTWLHGSQQTYKNRKSD